MAAAVVHHPMPTHRHAPASAAEVMGAASHRVQQLHASDSSDASGDAVNLFVNYLPLTVTDAELLQRFAPFGQVKSAKIMRHLQTDGAAPAKGGQAQLGNEGAPVQKSKGYGFVLMATREAAQQAIQALNGSRWDTKRLVVQVAQRLPADAPTPQREQRDAPPVPGRPAAPGKKTTGTTPRSQQQQKPLKHLEGEQSATIDIAPVSPACTLARLGMVLEVYGPVAAAEFPSEDVARVTFASASAAAEAARWLNGSRVPQVHPTATLEVSRVEKQQQRRAAPRRHRLELLPATPNSASTPDYDAPQQEQFNGGFSGGFQHHANSANPIGAGPCSHGPYCNCGGAVPAPPMHHAAPFPPQQQHQMPNYQSSGSDSTGFASGDFDMAAYRPQQPQQQSLPPQQQQQQAAPRSAQLSASGRHRAPPKPQATRRTAQLGAPRHHDPYAQRAPKAARPTTTFEFEPVAQPAVRPSAHVEPPLPPQVAHPGHECQYCAAGTTVILQAMPIEDAPCEQMINDLLGQIGFVRYHECWGNGQAVVTFADARAAADAVDLLHHTEQAVDYYDCVAGVPASQVRGEPQQRAAY